MLFCFIHSFSTKAVEKNLPWQFIVTRHKLPLFYLINGNFSLKDPCLLCLLVLISMRN